VGQISKALRFEILTRDGYRCRYCGAAAGVSTLHIDHVVPRALGGGDDASNLVTACADCNHGKSDRRIVGIPVGFSLTPDKRPAMMERARSAEQSTGHVLNCDNIEERDEWSDDHQLVWIWCETHRKYERHWLHFDYVHGGGLFRTDKKPV
jgi:hypothetical protein